MSFEFSTKDHGLVVMTLVSLLSLLGIPIEYSWQCECGAWEYGSIYRLIRSAYKLVLFKKCIKHREINENK